MPVGYHHLHYSAFEAVLIESDLRDKLIPLDRLRVKEKELRSQVTALHAERKQLADAILEAEYVKIRPHLRPCHQRRFDVSKKEVELELNW